MTIPEITAQIVEEFSIFDEWLDKYEYLIETGRQMPAIAPEAKTAENLIEGCQSRVWLDCREEDGKLRFTADSDAVITKGIISLLIRVFDGQAPADIVAADLTFIDAIGLRDNLSPTRANGLVAMITKIKAYALAFLQKEENEQE